MIVRTVLLLFLTAIPALADTLEERVSRTHIGAGVITEVKKGDWAVPIQGVSLNLDFGYPFSTNTDIHASLYNHILSSDTLVFNRWGADLGVGIFEKNTTTGSSTINLALTAYLHAPVWHLDSDSQNDRYEKQVGLTAGSDLKLADRIMLRTRLTHLFLSDSMQETTLISSSLQFSPPEY